MAADGLEIGAHIQASAAADAAQRFTQHGILAHFHPAVIHHDEMEFSRRRGAIGHDPHFPHRRLDHADVRAHQLSGGAGGEQLDEGCERFARGDNFLNARYGDVQRRHERGHADIGFAFDEHERARIRDDEIRAGDARAGMQKFVAQTFAREGGELFAGIERFVGFEDAPEELGDALAAVMNRGADDVRGLLVGILQDEFGEIGFRHLNAQRFERGIQVDFLGGHALALDGELDARTFADAGDVFGSIVRVRGQVEVAAIALHAFFKRGDQFGEPCDGVFLDGARLVF